MTAIPKITLHEIQKLGLTASDLGLGPRIGRPPGAKSKAGKQTGKPKGAKAAKAVRFRDDSGNTWVGRGPRPQWLRDALASGNSLEDFEVGKVGNFMGARAPRTRVYDAFLGRVIHPL